jgi:GxxExxY protein
LTESIIGAAIEVHRILGPGLLESIYEGHIIKGQRLNILVEGKVVVEPKAVSLLPDVATAQTLSYRRATRLKRALLLNFAESRLVDGMKRLSL